MNTQLTTLDSEHEKLTDKMWEVYLAMSHANMLKDRLEEDAEAVKEYLESMDARADSYAVQNVSSSYKCIVERLSDVTDLVEKLNNDYKAACDAYAECSMRISRYFNTH